MRPERDASRVAVTPLALEGTLDLAIDGTERRLLVNEHTGKVVYLGPTVAGKTHDKRAADEAAIAYPVGVMRAGAHYVYSGPQRHPLRGFSRSSLNPHYLASNSRSNKP
jgi:hypothetical protein